MKTRISRTLFLLSLFVLTQACAAASVGKPTTTIQPRSDARVVKPAVAELSGCAGERFRIDLLDALEKIPDDTLDAQREQLRDWVFTVTLARIAQRTSADEVLTGVADEPLVRDDALAQVLHMQSGPTRSTATKSGGAVVLVEADSSSSSSSSSMAAEVAEAIDEEALHIGSIPVDTQVYQYVFQPEVARAEVCAMKPLARAELESASQRYRSATITKAADLEAFLSGGVDLLSAQCTEAGLEVKGRQTPRTTKTPITVEHIAALSQARGTRYVPPERFGASLAKESKSNRAILDANAQVVDTLRAPLEIQSPAIQIVSAWKRQNPGVSTQELWLSFNLQQKDIGRPGFSLDPYTSPPFASKILDDIIDALPDVRRVAAILRGLDEPENAKWLQELAQSTNEPFAVEAKAMLIDARKKLAKATPEEAESILHPRLPGSHGNDVAADLLEAVAKQSTQQCARYDGPLLGTATGMTFFYTDLLAKIWKFDLNGAAPEGPIEGFQSSIHGANSTTSCEDMSGKNTRTWLGLREESFTREPSGAVRFQPIATRIFAKSSNIGARSEEFEATAESRRFVKWWDDHFAEIAAWEPQYEVLNQLMKWSVVIQNATLVDNLSCLAPLDGVAVRADHRIDKWIAETSDLRWHGPVELLRAATGAEGKPGDPECMPLFQSARYASCGGVRIFSGGVSAASLGRVHAKPIRATALPAQLGRLGGEVSPIQAGPGRVSFKSIARSGGKLENVSVESLPGKTKFTAEISTEVSQVGVAWSSDKRVPIIKVEKSVGLEGKAVVVTERRNGLVSAELTTSDLAAADVKVEVKPSPVLEAKSSAQKVVGRIQADGVGFVGAVGELPSNRPVVLLDDGSVAMRLDDGKSPKWVFMESGSGNRGPPPRGAQVSFSVGAMDGAAYRPGSPLSSRAPVVRVSILADDAATSLIKQQKGKPLPGNDADVLVKTKLDANDFDGAMKALDPSPSSRARAQLLDHALRAEDDTNVARVVTHAISKGASPSELREHAQRLQTEVVRCGRAGRDASVLETQIMKLAIAERRLQTPGRTAAKVEGVAKGEPAVYAPASYSIGAELPPAVHPPGKLVMPEEQLVTRTIEASSERLPDKLDVDGAKYEKRAPGKETAVDYGAVGSPFRLLFGGRRLVHVVMRCSDQNAALPPCHERPSPEEQQRSEEWRKCDMNGDHTFDSAEERGCLDEMEKRRKADKQAHATP